jgi:hypothetical protein
MCDKIGDTIECSQCGALHEKHKKHGRICKPCMKKNRMIKYRETKGAAWKKYEKTKKGFLMRLYRNMKSRVTGVNKSKWHLYLGKELLPKQDFYEWALKNPDFHELFEEWEKSGYERRLTPSVDRIDSRHGYCVFNMEFVPFHENCRNVRRV